MKQQIQQRKTLAEVSGFGVADDNAYFLNSTEIKTVDFLLNHDQDYLLLHMHPKNGMEFISVKFITAMEQDGWVTIDLENNQRPEKLSLGVPMIPGESRRYPFILMDIDTLAFEMNLSIKQKGEHFADIVSSMYETPGWERILRIIQDETTKMLRSHELLDFEF